MKNKELKGIELNVYKLLRSNANLMHSNYELIHEYYKQFIRENQFCSFEVDFLNGKVKLESITRAFRRIKELYPEYKSKELTKKEKVFRAHYKEKNQDLNQVDLL
jgi:hypothetical protein